jgi:SAM-dependent methyltransferase
VPAHFYKNAIQNPHQQRRHRAVLRLLQPLSGRVLDYGCGYGDLTWAISRTHADAVGVDVAPERVAFARSQYAPLRFEVCSDHGADLPAAGFDIVLSIVVTPFVPDPGAHVAELKRLLRPGGHLILATKTIPVLRRIYRRLRSGEDADESRPGELHHHTLAAANALVKAHGFTVLHQTAFYDPPFSNRKNAGDLLNSAVEFVGEGVGLTAPAPYPLLLARLDTR